MGSIPRQQLRNDLERLLSNAKHSEAEANDLDAKPLGQEYRDIQAMITRWIRELCDEQRDN